MRERRLSTQVGRGSVLVSGFIFCPFQLPDDKIASQFESNAFGQYSPSGKVLIIVVVTIKTHSLTAAA